MTNKELDRIGKMLSDTGKSKLKEFDIVFVIDATGSMGSYIEAAKCTDKDISTTLRLKFPDTNFQYGYVFYRDPIDSPGDFHEIINLTDNVNSLPEQIGEITAQGGGDLPEDWAGAYKKVNEEIKWRNGTKVIFHLADAGAHGKLFTPYDKYPDEEQKLITELIKCSVKKIKIFGFVIEEEARNSFEKCKEIYIKIGGTYEIYNFDKPKGVSETRSLFGGLHYYDPTRNIESRPLFGEVNYKIFEKKEDNVNNHHTSLFGNINNNNSSTGLFGNNNNTNSSTGLFGNNNINNSSTGLFGNNNINKSSTSLFGNDKINNNTTNIFGNFNSDNNKNIVEKNEEINNKSNSLFINNNNSNELFDFRKNKTENSLFGKVKENDNENNSQGLFGKVKENNNEENNKGLFGNVKENQDKPKNKEKNDYKDMDYQLNLNKSFFNLVVDSIQNVNKSEKNLFNNKNNSNE